MKNIFRAALFIAFSAALCMLSACHKGPSPDSPPDEYIHYTVNGTAYNYDMPMDSIIPGPDSVETANFNPDYYVYGKRIPNVPDSIVTIEFDKAGITTGSAQMLHVFFIPQTRMGYAYNVPTYATAAAPVMVSITEYGLPGQYISGNFSALFTNPPPTSTPYNVVCSFRIKRKN